MGSIIRVMGEFMWSLEGVTTEYGEGTNRHLPLYSLEGVKISLSAMESGRGNQ